MSESRPREDGGRELVEIDLLEVSVTSTPMHPSTRALPWKSAGTGLTPEHQAELDRYLVSLNKNLTAETEPSTATTKSAAPIQIATFEC